jgi:shikimate dehydrogenase
MTARDRSASAFIRAVVTTVERSARTAGRLTMRFAVIGHPVAHSKSPAMHAAAYRALGLEHEHTYDRIDTPPDQLAHRVSELRHHDLDGLNVTVPHKAAVLGLVDHVAPTAKAIGAANTLVRNTDGSITAHNTDAPALAEEIERLFRTRPETRLTNGRLTNRSAVVIGSGGAARAAVFALGMIGVTHVTIRARRPLEGAVDVPSGAQSVKVLIADASGQTVRTLDLGAQAPGLASFSWDGLGDSGVAATPGRYILRAQTYLNGRAMDAAQTLISAPVESVTLGAGQSGLSLSLRGLGDMPFSAVRRIG